MKSVWLLLGQWQLILATVSECNGQAINSSKYPKLYTLMHNTPDYRGVFLRGLGGNSASLGELQGDAIRNITGEINVEVQLHKEICLWSILYWSRYRCW